MASKLLLLLLLIPGLIGVAMLFPPGRRLVRHCVDVLLNGKTPLRWLAGLLAGILPPVTWTLAFKCARLIPDEWRPKIHTHVLPKLEAKLLSSAGILFVTLCLVPLAMLVRTRCHTALSRKLYPALVVLFPLWLKVLNMLALDLPTVRQLLERAIANNNMLTHLGLQTPEQDVVAWIFYGVLHFASPFIAGWWIWGFAPPGAAIVFGITLGAQNLCGLFTHLVFPNAAPWFYDVYPADTVPDYSFPGNPAGLVRVDEVLGTHLYRAAFKKSPVVFGALPSLHAATSLCFSLFVACYGGQWGIVTMVVYSTFMFWSTMYLHHHFAIDLLVGSFYALAAFAVTQHFLLRKLDAKYVEEGLTRGVDRLFCLTPRHAAYMRVPSSPPRTGTPDAAAQSPPRDEEESGPDVRSLDDSFPMMSVSRQQPATAPHSSPTQLA
ncbi:hypothetical protein DICSQDRAFT_164288 [Dichomitus squalens LYAD-421 SS1]|uniref:uncharacterized protein n=1 Tax=Dichomitus squalens (strain LYAD-421) TaxID=732165 RepID=UPI00044125E5|nr:uncharacterized protein DICSQDRAFT_164288 [Dichomitus squalens LYAD-421 SS1]EJF66438.1 hypothetical protein DICSQDRAFT_164288 [Dichomitus squalens LYAD-421 SS1]